MTATDILAAYCLTVLAVLYAWHRAHVLAMDGGLTCPSCSDPLPSGAELCWCHSPVCWGCHDAEHSELWEDVR